MIKRLVQEMTLREKVGQLNQKLYGWEIYNKVGDEIVLSEKFKNHVEYFGGVGAIYGVLRSDPWSNINSETGLNKTESQKVIKMISDYVNDNSRFNIRPIFVEETPHGHQGLNAIIYPVNLALACMFNTELVESIAKNIEMEMIMMNVNVGLFSGLDILRDQRWGRCEETFGEDPYLASMYTKAILKGANTEKFKVCMKHLAGQGAPYQGHNSGSVNIGIRELHEIHLPPIKKAVSNGLEICMAAYNEIDGIPCHINKYLLEDILRTEYGFKGIIMADGCALDRLISKNINIYKAGNLALNAGIGLSLWDECFTKLDVGVKKGIVDINTIDKAVENMLTLKKKLCLIDSEITSNFGVLDDNVSYNAASESIVLLKNKKNYLPFERNDSILIIGESDDLYRQLGDYTPFMNLDEYETIYKRLSIDFEKVDKCRYDEISGLNLSSYSKIILLIGGSSKRNFGDNFENNGALVSDISDTDCGENVDVGNLEYPQIQRDTAKILKHKKLKFVSIAIQGRGYALSNIAMDSAAILIGFYPGPYGSNAISNILLGNINPSGKLATSLSISSSYSNHYYNKKQDFSREDYINDNSLITFPFGFGLSYSEFKYSNFELKTANNYLNMSVNVHNSSKRDGKEVVQLYVKKYNSITTKRVRELIGFKKVLIKSEDFIEVKFRVDFKDLVILNESYKYEFESGYYKFIIGNGMENYLEKEVYL